MQNPVSFIDACVVTAPGNWEKTALPVLMSPSNVSSAPDKEPRPGTHRVKVSKAGDLTASAQATTFAQHEHKKAEAIPLRLF